MKRVFLTVLDAVGVGYLPDADKYGDVGACTFGHVVDACHPQLPNLARLGLGQIQGTHYPPTLRPRAPMAGLWKRARARTPPPAIGKSRASGWIRPSPPIQTAFRPK